MASLRLSALRSATGVSIRGGTGSPARSMARSASGGLTRRTRTAFAACPEKPSSVTAADESPIRASPRIGPRVVILTRIVRPVSRLVTSA